MPATNIFALLASNGVRIAPAPLIALTGAGGKTSLSQTLADELAHAGRASIATTTTHIMPPAKPSTAPYNGGLFLTDNRTLTDVAGELAAFFTRTPCGRLTLGLDIEPASGKLRGLNPVQICLIRERLTDLLRAHECRTAPMPAPCFLVEADGAARLPLKAHAPHEPKIPPCADLVIAVAGLDALGKPLAEVVHRPELAAERLSLSPNAPVTPAVIAALLLDPQGPFREDLPQNAPARAVFLNKEDAISPGAAHNGEQDTAQDLPQLVADALLRHAPGLTILVGSLNLGRVRLLAAGSAKEK